MGQSKILIVAEVFSPEEFNINDVALSWRKKGYDVGVLTMSPTYPEGVIFNGYKNKFYQKEIWNGVKIYRIWSVTGYKTSVFKKILRYFYFMVVGSVFSLFIGRRYERVFGFSTGSLTSVVPAVLMRKLYNKPLTIWVQDIWPDTAYAYGFKKNRIVSFFLDRFTGFVYSSADNIAVSCKNFRPKIAPYLKVGSDCHYLPNWAIDLNVDLTPIRLGEKEVQFTFAGNVGKLQNLDNIILAFNGLNAKYLKKAQLNIVGDGSELDRLQRINTGNSVVFHGRKARSMMASYYEVSDFLILSLANSAISGLTVPGKLQTYIAARKPILAIIDGESADIVKNNSLGLVTCPDDLDSIRNIFMQAIDMEKSTLKRFSEANDKLTNGVFNKDIIIEKLLQLTVDGN